MARKGELSDTCLSQEFGTVDRFTSLIDDLVDNILSRLPVKEAAKTRVLSKAWKYKWPSVCYLDIVTICSSFFWNARLMEGFNAFLSGCLQNNLPLTLGGFLIQDIKPQVATGMSRISGQRVGDLSINTYNGHGIFLHLPLDRSFRAGIIDNCFPYLESLSLTGPIEISSVQSPSAGELSLTFPVLKTLLIERCDFLSLAFLEFNVPKLIKFRIIRCDELNDCVIKIIAPRLNEFASSGGRLNEFHLYAPSLRYMSIEHEDMPGEVLASRAATLLTGVPSLEHLMLPYAIAQALVEWRGVYVLPALNRLKSFYFSELSMEDKDLSARELLEFFKQTHNSNPAP